SIVARTSARMSSSSSTMRTRISDTKVLPSQRVLCRVARGERAASIVGVSGAYRKVRQESFCVNVNAIGSACARSGRAYADAMERHEPPRWRGVNHLALITPDMDKTVRFYHGVLGMRLVATLSAGPLRHYFFEIGPENTVAFFEW